MTTDWLPTPAPFPDLGTEHRIEIDKILLAAPNINQVTGSTNNILYAVRPHVGV